ncbi:MAG TPA: hypothetical protein VM600_08725 [Actinomycetota bacterium]|nr:hypothetical protein [Actinomycetota bacterium]
MLALTPLTAVILGVILLFCVGSVLRMAFVFVRSFLGLTTRLDAARAAIRRASGEVPGDTAESESSRPGTPPRRKDR